MPEKKRKTKVKDKMSDLAERLNQVPFENPDSLTTVDTSSDSTPEHIRLLDETATKLKERQEKDQQQREEIKELDSQLFDLMEADEFAPNDFKVEIPVDSLESRVGYTSLIRQLHRSFVQMVAFYRSDSGGTLSFAEAREQSFRRCENTEEAKKIFAEVMRLPYENISFNSLHSLNGFAPRVAERIWERIKEEGRAEFESGHLAANTMSPVHYMKEAWNVAKYLGVRESFINEWQPKGGIELSMIDMLSQSFLQWQYWLEETVKRSQTEPRREHHEYQEWKRRKQELHKKSWGEGYWFPPYVREQAAIEHAVQMADRFNRIFMRTLRQLRDLRRYSQVTINNPNQVNIANDGGQQINMSKQNSPNAIKS
jgi:hypothetical protein